MDVKIVPMFKEVVLELRDCPRATDPLMGEEWSFHGKKEDLGPGEPRLIL